MNVIAIDTGKRGCGMALYTDNVLVRCIYMTPILPEHATRSAWQSYTADHTATCADVWISDARHRNLGYPVDVRVIVEFPRIYRGSQQEKDQNDLLDLAAVAGGIACRHACEYLHVSDWKGQLKKEQAWHHIWKRLSADEQKAYADGVEGLPKALHHNVQDAVGIGLWACGRFK